MNGKEPRLMRFLLSGSCWAAGLDGAFSFDVVVALGWPGPGHITGAG